MNTPECNLVSPMATDMYQLSMTYGYWKAGRHDRPTVFDLFFRECPFEGKYVIFAGLDECLKFISSFKFTVTDIEYLKTLLPHAEEDFFIWLATLDCSKVELSAMRQGELVFPREPLLRITGPLALGQLLETTLLNLVNFPSLIATNANRMRRIAPSPKFSLLEFGLRRAQGPDGGYSASKYSYLGGFDGTSNVLSGKLNGWGSNTVKGTMAHAFIMTYCGMHDLVNEGKLMNTQGIEVDFKGRVLEIRNQLGYNTTSDSELASFIAYAQAFPQSTLCLVDTYDTVNSGVPNFICVAHALAEFGYTPRGIRLDSGELGPLSVEVRKLFEHSDKVIGKAVCARLNIVASDDLTEEKLAKLTDPANAYEINTFGIGTNLVTCKLQPALGCVYKLVRIDDIPRIKLSENASKVTLPNCKKLFRFYDAHQHALCDVALIDSEKDPVPNEMFHYYRLQSIGDKEDKKYEYVAMTETPASVEALLHTVWKHGQLVNPILSISESRDFCRDRVEKFFRGSSVNVDKDYLLGLSVALHNETERLKIEMKVHHIAEEHKAKIHKA